MKRQPTISVRPREGELGRWRKTAGAEPLNAWIRQVCNEAADWAESARRHGDEVVALPEREPLTRPVEDGLTDAQRDLLRRRGMYDPRLSYADLQERLRAAEAMERQAASRHPSAPEPPPPADGLTEEQRALLESVGMYVEGEVPPAIRREHLLRASAMVPRVEPAVPCDGLTLEERRLLRARGEYQEGAPSNEQRRTLERDWVLSRPWSGMQRWFALRGW